MVAGIDCHLLFRLCLWLHGGTYEGPAEFGYTGGIRKNGCAGETELSGL